VERIVMRITWRRGVRLLALGTLVAAGACERPDARLEKLAVGISKDSVLAIMGGQPARTDAYLNQGQYIQALYFPPQGSAPPDSGQDRTMSPVILIGAAGKVTGWGWSYWDSVAAANKIQVAPVE